ncbi:dTDP-glucose 4,6-dehydratase [Candidatus Hydrogenisulfobacillus filiaventi]|uniref:dTDP-glucose 4,6-dehydratase n=1 Tax=Candidatus Hydrogenisulfobacillus filiaventi TaxID=2707344 RepID=A0A6F8ZD70_9FIRM|nr:dTDP-glucose 4,6-dehydratase [Candidatus Hydrogenisulfobacillus filiaventi]
MRLLVTGGLGFIGSNLVRWILQQHPDVELVNVDAETYAGNPANLADLLPHPRYRGVRADVADRATMRALFHDWHPEAVVHLAAESHVDRSLQDATPFLRTNVEGTQVLLDAARETGVGRFVYVSTDEVYGSLGPTGVFTETSPLAPRSPYAVSKAAGDLLAQAAYHTWRQPVIITRCSNNYGPYQYPEKFIPLVILNALEGQPIPLYGDGQQVRDWIHVEDHVRGLWPALTRGTPGRVYNLSARNEQPNRAVAETILALLGADPALLRTVRDRPGHDRRYALDPSRAEQELGFAPRIPWREGLRQTIAWYHQHTAWWRAIREREDYQNYYQQQYG